MLILHDNVESENAYKARLLLSLMGKEYKCIQYDVVNGETRTDEFLKKYNKNGRIPVLEFEDGKCLA
jgi:glutathione S-transferase